MSFRGWWDGFRGSEGEHHLPTPPGDGDSDPAPRPLFDPPAGAEERGYLVLTGTRVLGWVVEDQELAIDIYGGEGTWRAYRGLTLCQQGTVDGMVMLTLRAGGRAALDLDLLAYLSRWSAEGTALDVTVEVAGADLTAPGRRWTIGDQRQTITLSSAR